MKKLATTFAFLIAAFICAFSANAQNEDLEQSRSDSKQILQDELAYYIDLFNPEDDFKMMPNPHGFNEFDALRLTDYMFKKHCLKKPETYARFKTQIDCFPTKDALTYMIIVGYMAENDLGRRVPNCYVASVNINRHEAVIRFMDSNFQPVRDEDGHEEMRGTGELVK